MSYNKALKSNLYIGANGWIYYRKVINGQTIQLSTHTKSRRVANKLKSKIEYKALQSYYNPETGRRFLTFPKLVKEYLAFNHSWSKDTRRVNEETLRLYLKRGLPKKSASYISTYKSRVNTCIRWGINRGIETNKKLYTGNTMTEPRLRVFNSSEMTKILHKTVDSRFRLFVAFASYTGARRGELLNINHSNPHDNYVEVRGKTGKRLVKLNTQAKKIYQEVNTPWSYNLSYVSHHFKKNLRRLEIPNGRFQDLRRTFGYNLIKGGVPIYQVAKLLGHSKIAQTERNYAPLLVTDVGEYTLTY